MTTPYQEFLAERNEILRHKWFESEKRGYDIGYEQALLDWVSTYRTDWKKMRLQTADPSPTPQALES